MRVIDRILDVFAIGLTVAFGLLIVSYITPAHAHDIYTQWERPDTGGSCCNGTEHSGDCGPTRAYWDGSNWRALFHGKYVVVDPGKVLKIPNPDGNAHLCAIASPASHDGVFVFCFMPPQARF
jgi:hypothetical protein